MKKASDVYNYSLDAYGTPVVWYEMVKRFSAYTGNCIRVRRSSDNAEQDFGFVNDLLDTASLLSFVGAGNGFVTTFYTQVGTANVTQSTASQQPQVVSSGALITRNGFVSIKYNGVNTSLSYNTQVINTINTSYFSISQNDVANSVGYIASQSVIDSSSIVFRCDRSSNKWNVFAQTLPSYSLYPATLSIQRNDSNLRLLSSFINSSKIISGFDNGSTGGVSSAYAGTLLNDGLLLGGVKTPGLVCVDGSINCFGAYNTDNSANRVAIETILNNYYTIY